MISGNKGCAACKYRMTEDTGYSNWTVMGTRYTCLIGLHPDMPFDDDDVSWEESGRRMAFGETCDRRTEGDAAHFDVDGEVTLAECTTDDEVRELARRFYEQGGPNA